MVNFKEKRIVIPDNEIKATPLVASNREHFEIFKRIITDEKIVFNSWFIANNFNMSLLKNYCDNFDLKLQLCLADDPDIHLPDEVLHSIGKYSSIQLALNRFFSFEENEETLRNLYKEISAASSEDDFGYFKFENSFHNLLGGGALILDKNSHIKKANLALHILNQHHGIGDVCLRNLFKKAFDENGVDEIWSKSAEEDLEIFSFMSKHGMMIKDNEDGDWFYFIDKKIYRSLG